MAAPAPPGTAGHLMDRAPFLPGTGPYMISRYRPDSSLTLVRNPGFASGRMRPSRGCPT